MVLGHSRGLSRATINLTTWHMLQATYHTCANNRLFSVNYLFRERHMNILWHPLKRFGILALVMNLLLNSCSEFVTFSNIDLFNINILLLVFKKKNEQQFLGKERWYKDTEQNSKSQFLALAHAVPLRSRPRQIFRYKKKLLEKSLTLAGVCAAPVAQRDEISYSSDSQYPIS